MEYQAHLEPELRYNKNNNHPKEECYEKSHLCPF